MKTFSLLIFITTIAYISGQIQGPFIAKSVGQSYTVPLKKENSEGIKRSLFSRQDSEIFQYFYFCDEAKGENKKKCGAWVDEKGEKIKGANNNVKRTKEGGEISKMQSEDSGSYTHIVENPDIVIRFQERIKVLVQGKAKR